MSLEPDSAGNWDTLPALVGRIQHVPHCKEDQPKPQQGEQTPLLFPRWDLGRLIPAIPCAGAGKAGPCPHEQHLPFSPAVILSLSSKLLKFTYI